MRFTTPKPKPTESKSLGRYNTKIYLKDSGQVEAPPTDPIAAAAFFRRRHLRELLHPERHVVLASVRGLHGWVSLCKRAHIVYIVWFIREQARNGIERG